MHATGPTLPTTTAAAQFSISNTGALLYVPGGVHPEGGRALFVVDRRGSARELPTEPRPYFGVRLSPDGTRVALFARDAIRIYDISRGTTSLLERAGSWPIWTRDGRHITYTRNGALFLKPVDGSGPAEQLATFQGIPESWSRNGELAITHGAATNWNISVLSASEPKQIPALPPTASIRTSRQMDAGWLIRRTSPDAKRSMFGRIPDRVNALKSPSTAVRNLSGHGRVANCSLPSWAAPPRKTRIPSWSST